MNKKPFFSIVIPALNEEVCLPQLLSDLARQEFKDFEVIIVDAKSDDKTVVNAKIFADKLNLKIISSDKRNVSYQRNLGASKAKGSWLLLIDADVRFDKNYLSELSQKVAENQPDFFSTYQTSNINQFRYKILTGFLNQCMRLLFRTKKPFVCEAMIGANPKKFADLAGFNDKLPFHEGAEFFSRAKSKNYTLTIFKNITYVNNMRRLQKNGYLKTLSKYTVMSFFGILSYEAITKYFAWLYPMKGGSEY